MLNGNAPAVYYGNHSIRQKRLSDSNQKASFHWSGRLDSNQRPHAPQTDNVTARLLRCDDVNQHLRGSQLILLCAYARLELRVSIQARHSFPHMVTGGKVVVP